MSRYVRTLVLHLEDAEKTAGYPVYFSEEAPEELPDGYSLVVSENVAMRRSSLCWAVRWVEEPDPELSRMATCTHLLRAAKRALLDRAERALKLLRHAVGDLRDEEGL